MKTHSTRHRYKANPTAIRNLRLLLHFSAYWSRDSPPQLNDTTQTGKTTRTPHTPLSQEFPCSLSSLGGGPLPSLEGLFPPFMKPNPGATLWAFCCEILIFHNDFWSLIFLWSALKSWTLLLVPIFWPFFWSFCLRVLLMLWIAQWKSPNNEGLKS